MLRRVEMEVLKEVGDSDNEDAIVYSRGINQFV